MKLGANAQEVADRVAAAVVVVGVLGAPFYHPGALGAAASSAVLCLGLALAWRSVLRRDYAWTDPARLTWADFDDSRVRALTRRLLLGWGARFACVAYLTVVTAILAHVGAPAGFFDAPSRSSRSRWACWPRYRRRGSGPRRACSRSPRWHSPAHPAASSPPPPGASNWCAGSPTG
ncbi:hypothetical protein [Amycolatopsis minnesotensis]|uniref:Uncharacterized protein n=1 Tax=Amycolatopsis minnesotensis TaxID=337894 RepID=A0ABN2RGL6_9PSEU